MDDFTGADFSAAASATASPEASTPDVSSAAPTTAAPPVPTGTSTDPAATVQAGQAASASPVSEKPKGPIPFEVHDTALQNARTKTRAEVDAEWQPYAWAKNVPRETWESQVALAQRISTDPIGFLADFVQELQSHPTHAQQLRSHAGRILSSARGAPAVDLHPDLVVDDGQGRQIATFSADRVQAIVNHSVTEALNREIAPLKQDYSQRQAVERQAAVQQEINTKADAIFAEVTDILGDDTEAYTAVEQLMTQHPDWSAPRAAWHYHKTSVLPNLSKTERTKVLADISKKPAASTMSPSSGTTSAPKPDAEKDWVDLFREKAAALGGR